MISGKYELLEPISSGAYGKLYKGLNFRTTETVAIKIEDKNCEHSLLVNESKIYQYLGKMLGIPQLKWFGTDENYNYMVIELLGKSLSSIVKEYYALSIKTTLQLGIQMLKIIQSVHEKGIFTEILNLKTFFSVYMIKKNNCI